MFCFFDLPKSIKGSYRSDEEIGKLCKEALWVVESFRETFV